MVFFQPAQAVENFGLGPMEIRDQFPISLRFLEMYPENTKTVGSGVFQYSYQMAMANTFVNTSGRSRQITSESVKRGLVPGDFFSLKEGTQAAGYHAYIDVESYRHLFRFKVGFGDSFDLQLELPFVTFIGGGFDSTVESVHELVGIDNKTAPGAYRSFSDQNRYDYYLLRGNEFIIQTSSPFENEFSDPVIGAKWNLYEGADMLPAFSLKLAYKFPVGGRSANTELVSSGGSDWGYNLLISKSFGTWVTYLAWGSAFFSEHQQFSKQIVNADVSVEYRISNDDSILLQTIRQSSPFRTSGSLQGSQQDVAAALLSRSSDLFILGYKYYTQSINWEFGIVEDYSSANNTTDFVIFFEIGQQW